MVPLRAKHRSARTGAGTQGLGQDTTETPEVAQREFLVSDAEGRQGAHMLPSSGASDESRKEPHDRKYRILLDSSGHALLALKSIATFKMFKSTWKRFPIKPFAKLRGWLWRPHSSGRNDFEKQLMKAMMEGQC